MNSIVAETEFDCSEEYLDSLPQSPSPGTCSTKSATRPELLTAPTENGLDSISTRVLPPRRKPELAPGRRAGGPAPLSLVSSSSLQTATEILGPGILEAISSALAHQMRGPLRWVTSFSELLVEEKGGTLDQAGRDYLERIASAAVQLDQITQVLQKFVAAALQKPHQQNVSLEAVVCAVVGSLTADISTKAAEVTLQHPLAQVMGDPECIQQCLAHLLDNALKFVSPGTSPSVQIWTESRPGVERLYVEDQGPGVPAIHQEHIFDLFVRLDHDFPGTGAGLALTRQVCERMGGRAGVESEPGEGSRFWIELPKAC